MQMNGYMKNNTNIEKSTCIWQTAIVYVSLYCKLCCNRLKFYFHGIICYDYCGLLQDYPSQTCYDYFILLLWCPLFVSSGSRSAQIATAPTPVCHKWQKDITGRVDSRYEPWYQALRQPPPLRSSFDVIATATAAATIATYSLSRLLLAVDFLFKKKKIQLFTPIH